RLTLGALENQAGRLKEAAAAVTAGCDALDALRKADPRNADIRQRFARAAAAVADGFAGRALWAEAAGYYDRAVEAGHPDPWVLARCGQCYWAAGDGASYQRVRRLARD